MYILRGVFRKFLFISFSFLISFTVLACVAYLYIDSQLPNVETLKSVQLPIPLRVYTSDGHLLAEFGELHRTPVPLNQIPPMLIKAVLATEDQRFYEHSGVDFLGLLRASSELVMTGTKAQGGSTITMQVARNFYLTRKKTFVRKLTEILLAQKIEREFTKDQILELYLNKIYLGNRAYGVAAAAQVYYGKPLNQLTLPELALIAGLPKAPSTINPVANPVASKIRRDHVLQRMYEIGDIDKKTYLEAIRTPLTATYHGAVIPVHAPYVAEMVRNMMVTSFGDDAYTKGFNVYTTVSTTQQAIANKALRDALLAYDHRHGYRGPEGNLGLPSTKNTQQWLNTLARIPTINDLRPAAVIDVGGNNVTALLADGETINIPWSGLVWAKPQYKNGWAGPEPKSAGEIVKLGDVIRVDQQADGSWALEEVPAVEGAFVALNPNTGAIDALVGGFDFQRSKFNRAVQAEIQPGSGFKPFIYAAALAKGYTLASVISDSPISFWIPGQQLWRPQNDDHKYGGPTRLRYALAKSVNVVAVRLLVSIGVPYALKYISRFGFDPNVLPRNYSLALGTGEVTPLQLVRGYATFANGGYRVTPYLIDHITNNDNQLVYKSAPKVACTECIVTGAVPAENAINAAGERYAPQAIPPQIAFLMTSALQDVINYGTGTAAKVLGRTDIAGKTGTTQDQMNAWFSGFNSDIVATAWVGYDTPSSLHEFGAQAALPMWINFMKVALANVPNHTMPEPPDITSADIDPQTGFVEASGKPEFFRSDEVPQTEAASVPTNSGDVAANSSDVTTNSGDGAAGSKDVATNSGDGAAGSKDVATNSGDGAAGSKDVATNSGDGAAGSKDVATNSGDVATTDTSNEDQVASANPGNLATTTNPSQDSNDIAPPIEKHPNPLY